MESSMNFVHFFSKAVLISNYEQPLVFVRAVNTCFCNYRINSFSTNVPLLQPLKTYKNLRIYNAFMRYGVDQWLKMGKQEYRGSSSPKFKNKRIKPRLKSTNPGFKIFWISVFSFSNYCSMPCFSSSFQGFFTACYGKFIFKTI